MTQHDNIVLFTKDGVAISQSCKIRIGILFMSRMVSMSFGVNFYGSRLLRQGGMLFLGKGISRRFDYF